MEILRFVLILACCCTVVVSNVIDRKLIMKQKQSKLSHTKTNNSPRTAVGSQGSSGFSAWLDHICTASKDCVPCADAKNGLEYCGPNSDNNTYDSSFYFGDTAFDYSFYSGKSHDDAVDGQCSQWTWTCNSTYTCFRVLSYNDDCEEFKCKPNEFQCPNSTVCIPCAKVRDWNNDCSDYSDEYINYSIEYYFSQGFAKCPAGSPHEGMPIPKDYLCDNYNDCGDASDESLEYCPGRHCAQCDIKCNTTNICIPQGYYDDGENDCGDFSDEPNYLDVKCEASEFQCQSSTVCIPCAKHLDGNNDCGDDSDEMIYFTFESSSVEGFVECPAGSPHEGKTIPKSWLCDNYNDCGDASDESLEYCPERHCENCQKKCNTTNMCIPQGYTHYGNYCGDTPFVYDSLIVDKQSIIRAPQKSNFFHKLQIKSHGFNPEKGR